MTAGRLVFATNAYSHLFPDLARKQVPAFTYMIATEPLSDEQLAAIGWEGRQGVEDARNLIHYYRLTPDGRLMMGGGPVGLKARNDLGRDNDEDAWRHLEEHIHWLWPHLDDLRVTHRWGGAFSVTMDLTPALGYVGESRRAVYSLGCIGHGVAMSYLNGRMLAELLVHPSGHRTMSARSSTGACCRGRRSRWLRWSSMRCATTCEPRTRSTNGGRRASESAPARLDPPAVRHAGCRAHGSLASQAAPRW